MQKFKDLGLNASIIDALAKKGFETPTPIQEQVIPMLLQGGVNVMGQAQTGTGKTAAFGLPMVQNIEENTGKVQAIVLAPTRELAMQVANEITSFKGNKRLFVTTVYGGQSIDRQIKDLNRGADIVVGTPGRVIDLIKRKKLRLDHIQYFVLDEADEMLNMGFIEDIEFILNETNDTKQVLLFSATMPKKIIKLAKRYMGEYQLVQVKREEVTTTNVEQLYYAVNVRDKMKVLKRILEANPDFYGIVFCNTRMGTDDVTRTLNKMDYAAEALHGDIAQNQRERILSRFKNKSCTILCATDVAARGIDVDDLTHVINYQLPQDPEAYVHRIGRTGRAGKEGIAISLVASSEKKQKSIIESIAKTSLKRAELPSADELIEAKTSQIYMDILSTEVGKEDSNVVELANQLLENNDAESVLVATLKHFLQAELSAKHYEEIKMPKNLDSKNSNETRLFIAKGKRDNMNKEDLEFFICKQSGIDNNAFLDTYMLDNFSFITLQNDDAEVVLHSFSKIKNNGKSLVVKAKSRDGERSGGKRNSGGGGFKGKGGGSKRRGKRNNDSSFRGSRRTGGNDSPRRKSKGGEHKAFYSSANESSKYKNAKY